MEAKKLKKKMSVVCVLIVAVCSFQCPTPCTQRRSSSMIRVELLATTLGPTALPSRAHKSTCKSDDHDDDHDEKIEIKSRSAILCYPKFEINTLITAFVRAASIHSCHALSIQNADLSSLIMPTTMKGFFSTSPCQHSATRLCQAY